MELIRLNLLFQFTILNPELRHKLTVGPFKCLGVLGSVQISITKMYGPKLLALQRSRESNL